MWKRPKNVPHEIICHIIDAKSRINLASGTETVYLTGLENYHRYNVIIYMKVTFENQDFDGVSKAFDFKTDVGVPGAVQELYACRRDALA